MYSFLIMFKSLSVSGLYTCIYKTTFTVLFCFAILLTDEVRIGEKRSQLTEWPIVNGKACLLYMHNPLHKSK